MIKAKPVVTNRYWILKHNDQKVGQVEADDQGYVVKIHNRVARYKTIPMVRKHMDIDFVPPTRSTPPIPGQVHGFETGCRAYNAMWSVRHRLPLFTKTAKSKSWFAAGWFAINQNRNWRVERNPKLIVLERYEFRGPFHNREQANESI